MDEIDLLTQAKQYIDSLSVGKNPFDGEDLPITDNSQKHQLARCLSFVSGVLQKVIDNGGMVGSTKGTKLPFYITCAEKANFEYSKAPITVSEIARRINAAVRGERKAKLRYSSITFWLIETGMLEIEKNSGVTENKYPSKRGEELGISIETRTGANGDYDVIVYNEAAQRYILDNIDAIVSSETVRFEMQGKQWSISDDDALVDMALKGVPIFDISVQLRRNISSVRSRLKKLGLESLAENK